MEILYNKRFKELINCSDRYLVLYGSRGSSKSNFVAMQIVMNLVSHKFYRLVAIRELDVNLEKSVFREIKDKIDVMGLTNEFKFKFNPLEITHIKTGNEVIFRGLNKPDSLKSLNNPTAVWFEEEIPKTEEAYNTISATLRTPRADYIQEIFTFNPVIEDYENHWFYKRFFEGTGELSFRTCLESEVNGTVYRRYATIHHSTFRDNSFLPPDQWLTFEAMKTNPVQYQQEALGLWCNKIVKNQFYKQFSLDNNLQKYEYNNKLPLHLSFDFNVEPYITCLAFQASEKNLYQIDEFCLKNPDNTTKALCESIRKRFYNHEGGMFIYGDAAGYHKDTRMEKGGNDYVIIFRELSRFHPNDRTTRSNPSVKMRGNFINELFLGRIEDCRMWISPENSKHITLDLLNVKEDPDGSKLKEKVKDRNSGISYEKYGHTSDALDYVICQYFTREYNQFVRGTTGIISGKVKSKWRSKRY
jgi:PBSX family phage terminase large subunit